MGDREDREKQGDVYEGRGTLIKEDERGRKEGEGEERWRMTVCTMPFSSFSPTIGGEKREREEGKREG